MPAEFGFKNMEKYCLECGKDLKLNNTRDIERKKFCSKICLGKYNVTHKITGTYGFKFSSKSKEKMSNAKRGKYLGENNSNWKGGKKKNIKHFVRNSWMYRKWRIKILERDFYICQSCNKRENQMEVHHIYPFISIIKQFNIIDLKKAEGCDALWDIDNGVTLCKHCHRLTKIEANGYGGN